MFSNDKNIETIAQLGEVLKNYIGLQTEYVKLDVVEKVVKLLTAITLTVVFITLFLIALIYFSFAAAYALEALLGSLIWSFSIIGCTYVAIFFFTLIFRHTLIEKPLVKFLASLLLAK
ncbi:hypothetical protein [Prevotella bivia]|uniref:Phage holin family protein n=1 Tax=Prevotella bivia DSM 20514 TaxID=868129 RepID=I4ZBF7_9BACT|nr:hypothetical protein [Prevotella bivia]EFB93538.1 hypothetical protein HMPREF0648_1857 [Prevotella bivia JCVIHMP010]EIM33549.1 Protein of unknown function (DUF1469) [Prevotella bivia DSM 20514]KXU59991.1 hypothetical protein HMPREF3218_0200243 [Prevotella bivia]